MTTTTIHSTLCVERGKLFFQFKLPSILGLEVKNYPEKLEKSYPDCRRTQYMTIQIWETQTHVSAFVSCSLLFASCTHSDHKAYSIHNDNNVNGRRVWFTIVYFVPHTTHTYEPRTHTQTHRNDERRVCACCCSLVCIVRYLAATAHRWRDYTTADATFLFGDIRHCTECAHQ